MLVGKYNPAKTKTRFAQNPPHQNLFNLLQNCNTLTKLSQIHAQLLLRGISHKSFLLAKLLYLYVFYGHPKRALIVSRTIEKPTTTVWNQIIRAHGFTDTPWKSLESFKKMADTEPESGPDAFTYSFLLSACARGASAAGLREGEQVHGRVLINGFCCNVFVQTNLINLYAASGGSCGVGCARRVFDEMSDKSLVSWNALLKGYVRSGDIESARRVFNEIPGEKSVVSWTTMLSGCVKSGRWREALSLFHYMRRIGIELDQVVLASALSACAELGDLRLGQWIHRYAEKVLARSALRLVSLSNALIHMYVSCSEVDEAHRVFESMNVRSTATWTTIITGLAKQGRGKEAVGMFRRMLLTNEVIPDEVTFIGVLCACSHSGFVNEGLELFEFMTRKLGIIPRIKHYGCLVDLLSRAGLLDEAQAVIKTMPMEPGHAVWGALLNGCRLHGHVELATRVAEQLALQLDPNRAAGYFVLLSNVYAASRRWREAGGLRHVMVQMGISKPPGKSWIQIDGVVYGFFAGDMSPSLSSSIHEMVNVLARHSRWERDELDVVLCLERSLGSL